MKEIRREIAYQLRITIAEASVPELTRKFDLTKRAFNMRLATMRAKACFRLWVPQRVQRVPGICGQPGRPAVERNGHRCPRRRARFAVRPKIAVTGRTPVGERHADRYRHAPPAH